MKNRLPYIISASAFAIIEYVGLKVLDKLLIRYEAEQPDTFAEEVFRQYFYNGTKTDYIKTTSGLSDDKKYIVRMNNTPIATFVLTEADEKTLDNSKWELKKISMIIPAAVDSSNISLMSEEQRNAALGALKSRAEYFIRNKDAVRNIIRYYDRGSSAYTDLVEIGKELWMNDDGGHSFRAGYLSDYIQYSDKLFSVHGNCIMDVYCKDDSIKDYNIDITMFFYNKAGKWLCFETSNRRVPVDKSGI